MPSLFNRFGVARETVEEYQLRTSFERLKISQPSNMKNPSQNENRHSKQNDYDPDRNRTCQYCEGPH